MTKLLLVGGFLGAGKTTLLLRAARTVAARGLRVGLVTNDQGDELVDSALATQQRVPVVEVAGGCFCCRFPDLIEGLHHLQKEVAPEVILAEPVGSCTDLIATVVRPLLAHHADEFEIAPLTVLLDSTRSASRYTGEIDYLYQKQIAEAELLAISKIDQLDSLAWKRTQRELEKLYSPTLVYALSARCGDGIEGWLDQALAQKSRAARALRIDYQRYATAEAELGWLNTRGWVEASYPFSPKNWMTSFFHLVDEALRQQNGEVAHIKMQARADEAIFKASLTQSGGELTWDHETEQVRHTRINFVLNARVNTLPQTLETTVRRIFAEVTPEPEFHYEFIHFECFSPKAPTPTYRIRD